MNEKMKKFSDYIGKSAVYHQAEPEGVLKGRFKVMKSDDEKMLAFGWASVSMRVDGEVIWKMQPMSLFCCIVRAGKCTKEAEPLF